MTADTESRMPRRAFLSAADVSIALPCRAWSRSAPRLVTPRHRMRMVCISTALGMNPEASEANDFRFRDLAIARSRLMTDR